MNYNNPDGEELFLMKFFNEEDVHFAKDSCNVSMGDNYFRGNLKKYEIYLTDQDFEGFGIQIKLDSNLKPYRPQDGIIKAGEDYFAWLAAVPNGVAKAKIFRKGKTLEVQGSGYHDHNWGNTPLQYLFDGWVWFRGEIDDKTVVASVLYMSDKRGGYEIPILYVADSNEVLMNKFGEDVVFTKRSNIINGLYNKTNEPLFRQLDFITENGFQVSIKG